jgi:hypothetical protein
MREHVRESRTLVLKTNIELKIFFNVFLYNIFILKKIKLN